MEYPTFTAAELLEMLTLPGLPDINAVKDLFENTIKAPLQLPVNGYNTVASIVNDMLGLLNVPGEIYNGIVGVAFDLIIDNLVNPPPPAPGPSALQGQLDEIDEWAEQQEIETGIPPDEEVVENMKRPIYAVLNPLLKEIAYFQEMKEKKMITSVIAKLPTINLDDYIPDLPDLPSGDTYVHSSIWPGNLEMTERHLSFKVFVKDGTNQSWDSVLQPNRGVNAKKTPINVWGDTENPLGFYALSKIKGGEWKDVIPALNKDSENMFYANRETVPLASSGNGNEKSIATVTMPWGSTVLGTSPVRWNTYGSDTVNLKASGGSANHAYGINITSLFGERNAPGSSNGDPVPGSTDHRGVDVTFRIGTNVPIFATASGVVTEIHSLNNTDSGYYVKIEHFQKVNGYRVMTSYSHLKDDPAGYLSVGQVVSMGTQVGVMGGTGGGTGIRWAIHLHFGLRLLKKGDPTAPYGIGSVEKNFAKNGNAGRALGGYVDPMPFINFG
jgi:murein DD-endopeptidase MepM/ murein hydrolase activator NlpD